MIQLYPKGTTAYTSAGVVLHPQEASVTWQSNGRYDLNLTIPREMATGITFDYGQIIRCPVPVRNVAAITLGTVSYWETTAEVPLYSRIPTLRTVKYAEWEALRSMKIYAVGDKVSYLGENFRMTALDPGSEMNYNHPPNNYPQYWEEIPLTTGQSGKVAATLPAGTQIMKTGDFNSTYMQAATTGGVQGYIEISKCSDQGTSEQRVIPAFTITEQSFVINTIEKDESGHAIRIDAEHISYALGRTILGECNVTGVNPATALMFIVGAMKEDYPGNLYTNITGGTITTDWSWKNAQSAILDPKSGILNFTDGQIIRNDYDVYLITNPEGDATYQVAYGVNMKTVKWKGDVSSLVTRIYPTAQREDGTTMLLPEEKIDTSRTIPFVRPEVLNTGLKIGQKVTNSDGTEVELTEDEVYTRMRSKANDRFNVDKCDRAEITLELDWIHMPDTAEYAQYTALANAAPGDWVRVVNGPMGLSTVIQMTGYTFDPILGRYVKTTFGEKKQTASVASYDILSGAVTGSALASGAVTSENIAAGTITAREIEANSITAEKIASRNITTELLAAGSVTADEIAALAITTEKLAAGAITAAKIAAGTITADQIAAGSITTVLLAASAVTADKIAANSVTADKIGANAITAEKINAGAVTADKVAAGAVTADKIAAGAISATKIDTTDITAINATLGTAAIANAQIAAADISFAKVKDLNASSAYFGQAVFQEGLANKLFVPRLSVAYAQIVNATISDLVIQASDGNYYELDVDLDGSVTATQITPTAEEIEQGHTTAGQTIYMGTQIVAEDLSTTNIYASHALMDEITASILNVDKLLAREATIAWLNVQDLSSNTYIQSTVGDWDSGSTITQTISGINQRISSLGYGTVYMQPTAPPQEQVVSGDIWIQTAADSTWENVSTRYASWQDIVNQGITTWQVVGGIPVMWVNDGRAWKKMYDAYLPTTLETQIEQLADQVNLRATKEETNILTGEVRSMSAQLSVQAGQIESAVRSVNNKTACYVMWEDPRTLYDVTLGDIWIKTDSDLITWASIQEKFDSWNDVAAEYDAWLRMSNSVTYVWDDTQWVETADLATQKVLETKITQTDAKIELLASAQANIQGSLYKLSASLSITAGEIRAEVERASAAEAGKISKTAQYQTADAIVTEAVSQATTSAGETYIAKTTTYQTADQIVSEAVRQAASGAGGAYIAKTSTYQTADSITNEAVRLAGVAADDKYIEQSDTYKTVGDLLGAAQSMASSAATTAQSASIAKTSTYQTAEAIVNSAVAAIDNVPVFSTATAYNVGQVVVYGGHMYKFKVQHSAGAWNASHVDLIGVGSSYIAQTTSYQTADQIYSAATEYVDGQLSSYSTIQQTSTAISAYVTNNAYGIQSGISITAEGIDISGSKHVIINSGSLFSVSSSGFGVYSTNTGDNAVLWAGAATAADAKFKVTANGKVTLTSLMVLNEAGTEEPVNLKTANLWKLNYSTIKQATVQVDSSGYCTSFMMSNGTTVNFKSASTVRFSTAVWGEKTYVTSGSVHGYTMPLTVTLTNGRETSYTAAISASEAYDDGKSSVTLSSAGWSGITNTVTASNGQKLTIAPPQLSVSQGEWSTGQLPVRVLASGSSVYLATDIVEVPDPNYWSISYTAAGATVSFRVGGKSFSHFFAD